MGKILAWVLGFVLSFALAHPAGAAIFYGLAMQGSPKDKPGFTHFAYTNPGAPKGGTLRQAQIGSFDSLNPYAIKGTAARGLHYTIDTLMRRSQDEPFTMYPLIAEREDVAPDRSAITFYLNPKARFHDGTPITADDVLFSFHTLLDQGRPNMRNVYKLVNTAEKIDARTVKFTLKPGYSRETVMILSMMPVLCKAWWTGRVFDSSTLDIPVSSGPYKITAMDPGHSITYTRVKNYWAKDLPANKGLYNFDRITDTYFRNDTAALEAFLTGQLNFRREYDPGKWANGYAVAAVKNGTIIKEAVPNRRTGWLNALVFNTRRTPFNDVRVREALSLALDFKWVNENLFYGLYKRTDSYYPNSELAARGAPDAAEMKILDPFKATLSPAVFAPIPPLPATGTPAAMRENLRKADMLLKQAGWIVQNGQRVNARTGKAFTFEILLGDPKNEKLALAFANGLHRLGITAQVHMRDSAAYIARMNHYDFDMTMNTWFPSLSPGTEQALYWGCAAASQPARMNYAGICAPAIESILRGIANAQSRADLIAHTRALDRILLAGHYIIPLFYADVDFVAYNKAIHRPAYTPLYGIAPESWWMAGQKPSQKTPEKAH